MRYFYAANWYMIKADYLGRNPNPEADWHFALPVIMWEIPLTQTPARSQFA